MLSAPEPLPHLVHVPAGLEPWMRAGLASHLARSRPRLITGCVLSGLLSARFDHLPPTLGLIDRATALKHYEALDALGFEAAGLHLDDTCWTSGSSPTSGHASATPPGPIPRPPVRRTGDPWKAREARPSIHPLSGPLRGPKPRYHRDSWGFIGDRGAS